MTTRPNLDLILRTINEALFTVDPRCRITAFNEAAERLTGYREDEVVGRPCAEVFRSDICRDECAVKESIARGCRVPHRRVVMRDRTGSPLPISVASAPLVDATGAVFGAVETIRPLNEVERMNDLLAREMAQKRSILDSLAEGVVTVDQEWKVTSMNTAAERMLDKSARESIGRFCRDVLCTDRCLDGCPLAATLEREQPVRDELLHMTRRDGSSLEVSLNAAVLRGADGEAMGGVLSFRPFCEVDRLRMELAGSHHFRGIIGKAPSMKSVFQLVEDVARSSSTVLITGDSGTGKEMVANALQSLSTRSTRPFIKVNCAIFSDGVLESELFGHVRGAFTDAHQDRRGRFELADGGTIFLDEIGDISPRMQVKLLRVIQEKQFERVGGEESISVDVRVIAATHRDLNRAVRDGRFREDLYYRLNVIPIHLPPLRERREDIPLLVDHFLRKYQLVTGKDVSRIQDRVMDVLVSHPWPGNVRQLENTIEYAFARARSEVLTVDLLPPDVRQGVPGGNGNGRDPNEAAEILQALQENHWHHSRAAVQLGISRTTLWRKMKKHGLSAPA